MLTCEINPTGVADEYLAAVNRCFPGWGDRSQFAWVFGRAVGAPIADLMILRRDGVLLAGSGVSYRWVQRGDQRMLVGIMTGSWTLPEARGQGCFMRVIAESVELTVRRGGALLLAFVTEANASYRRLRDAGAALFETQYLFAEAPAASSLAVGPVEIDTAAQAALFARHAARSRWSVAYDLPGWRSQLLARGRPTEVVRAGREGMAILELAGGSERLLAAYAGPREPFDALISSLAARAAKHGRRLVMFAADAQLADAARAAGLTRKAGFITALAADAAALAAALGRAEPWAGRHADLADPASPWYLGNFGFHDGDRM